MNPSNSSSMQESGENIFSNPYVLIGGALLIFWFFRRKNIIKKNANASKSINELSSFDGNEINYLCKKFNVPPKLVKDVQKMNVKELATAILDNQKMINKSKMSNDERNTILKMIAYMEYELEKKM